MKIHLNEREIEVDADTTLFQLRDREKPGADIWVHNGAAVVADVVLKEDDCVSLIQRGEIPPPKNWRR